MKPLRFLALFVSHLVLFLVALNQACSGLGGISQDPVLAFVPQALLPLDPLHARLYWFAALLLVALYWVATLVVWQRRPGALRVRTSTGDNLLIHPGAIMKFVRVQIENHPAVVSQKLRVRQSGSRGISIRALVTVRPIASLPEIKRQLESSIRDGFSQVMGIEKVDDITIILGLDEKELGYRPGSAAKAAAAPAPPVRAAERTLQPPSEPPGEPGDLSRSSPSDEETDPNMIAIKPPDQN